MSNVEVLDYIKKSFELKNKGYYKPAIEMLYKALTVDADNVEILAQLAHLYFLLENWERAVYYIEKVLDISPKHIDCLKLLQEIDEKLCNYGSAKLVCDKICELQATSENYAKQISILNKLKDYDAIKKIESLPQDILNDEIFFALASTYYEQSNFEKSKEFLYKTLDFNPQNDRAMLLLAKIMYDEGAFEESKKMFTKLDKISPNAQVWNYLGLFELNAQNFSKAGAFFAQAQKAEEKNAEYAYNLASAYFLNGWLDEASRFFNLAVCLEPMNVNYHFAFAYLHYQKKDYDKAVGEIGCIKTIEPQHVLSNVLESLIAAKKGDLLSAKNRLETIVKDYDEDDFIYSALCEVYKELMMYDLGKKAILRALDIKPNSVNYLSQLAEFYMLEKNYEEAEKTAHSIIDINENFVYASLVLAKICLAREDFENLYDWAQGIIELDSSNWEGYYYNAVALFNQGDKTFALESLKKAISLNLDNAELYLKMSEFYQDMGDFVNAYVWAQEAGEIEQRDYRIKWLCARLAATLKKEDEALKLYSFSYRLAPSDKELAKDYSNYLISIGKKKQSEKILKKI